MVRVTANTPLSFSFTVTDRDTPLDGLTITARIVDVTNPDGYTTTLSEIVATPNASGGYDCTATLTPGALDPESTLTQRVVITVTDGTYTSEKEFTIYHKPFVLIPFADGTHGTEIWKTDGIVAELLNDANPGTGDVLYIGYTLHRFGKTYLFMGDNGSGEKQPCIATADGEATPLKEGLQDASYTSFATLGGQAFFRTAPTSTQTSLWATDGTADGTAVRKTISDGKIEQLKAIGSSLYFYVNGKDSSSPDALWKSDGTAGGTVEIKGSLDIEGHLTSSGGKLFFASDDMGSNDCGLWVSDGTPAGTQLVKRFENPPWNLTDAGGVLYFHDHYQTTDTEGFTVNHMDLWRSDGTPAGTAPVMEMEQRALFDPTEMFVVEGTLYFARGKEIWTSNGTEAGTVIIYDMNNLPDFDRAWDRLSGRIIVVGNTFYIKVKRFASPVDYQIYSMQPGTNHDLMRVSERTTNYITVYGEPAGMNECLFSTQDNDHHYLWKHTVEDDTALIKTTDK